ncbi:hypothetical protein MLD38_033319 [Melastoma candidum]|uniref:Uncharacterized protein n=1 Tax=Melastoma candidum TaxID=119954 RepID=A0ACB9M8F9_9MYRT|nr:hypothetical protein MLD38_033319 [Melastoma candidum]
MAPGGGLLVYTRRNSKKYRSGNGDSTGIVGDESPREIKPQCPQELAGYTRRYPKKIDAAGKKVSTVDGNEVGTSGRVTARNLSSVDHDPCKGVDGVEDSAADGFAEIKILDDAEDVHYGFASDAAAVGSEQERQREIREGRNEFGDLAKRIEEEESRISNTPPREARKSKPNRIYSCSEYLLRPDKLSSSRKRQAQQEVRKNEPQKRHRGTGRPKGNTPVAQPPRPTPANLRIRLRVQMQMPVAEATVQDPPHRAGMTEREKMALYRRIKRLPEDKKLFLVNFIRSMGGEVKSNEDEIDLDLDILDDEILWEVEKLFPDRLRDEPDNEEVTSPSTHHPNQSNRTS